MTPRNASPKQPEVDRLIAQWQEACQRLAIAKEDELRLRSLLIALFDPRTIEGTETLPVSHGFKLKAVKAMRYSFPHANAARDTTLTLAADYGQEGQFIANRLIAWKPELIVREYRTLSDDMLAAVNRFIIARPAQAQLVLVAPKSAI